MKIQINTQHSGKLTGKSGKIIKNCREKKLLENPEKRKTPKDTKNLEKLPGKTRKNSSKTQK